MINLLKNIDTIKNKNSGFSRPNGRTPQQPAVNPELRLNKGDSTEAYFYHFELNKKYPHLKRIHDFSINYNVKNYMHRALMAS